MRSLSIVIPTRNRSEQLSATLAEWVGQLRDEVELIVVDDASTDDTPGVLAAAADADEAVVRTFTHTAPQGRVQALIDGFNAATGDFVCWLDDRIIPTPGTIELAMDRALRSGADVGLLAMFHERPFAGPTAYAIHDEGRCARVTHVHGTLVADYGLIRRDLYHLLGGFDVRFRESAAGADLSFRTWTQGLRVLPVIGTHLQWIGEAHLADTPAVLESDERRLLEKWHLPPRHADEAFHADQPCTLHRAVARAA